MRALTVPSNQPAWVPLTYRKDGCYKVTVRKVRTWPAFSRKMNRIRSQPRIGCMDPVWLITPISEYGSDRHVLKWSDAQRQRSFSEAFT
jgi:hypothetical protein